MAWQPTDTQVLHSTEYQVTEHQITEHQTARLTLRRADEDDLNDLYSLDDDPRVMRFLNGGTHTPRDVFKAHNFPQFLSAEDNRPGFGFWLAHETNSEKFVGWFSLRGSIETAELGYRLAFWSWGKGYATEGAHRVVEHGFDIGGVQRITAQTYEDNVASQSVLTKVGLSLKRRFRLAENDIAASTTTFSASNEVWDGDDLEFELERDQWLRRKTASGSPRESS